MGTKSKRRFVRGMAVALSISMLGAMPGCGNGQGAERDGSNAMESSLSDDGDGSRSQDAGAGQSGGSEGAGAETGSEGESDAGASNDPAAVRAKINDNGKPIMDFEEFVNGSWKQEQKGTAKESFLKRGAYAKTKAILDNADLEALSSEEGLYKLVTIYREMTEQGNEKERFETMKKHLAPINKVKSLKDLYALYGQEEYSLYNCALRFIIGPNNYGGNSVWLRPVASLGDDAAQAADFLGQLTMLKEKEYLGIMQSLGYSEKRSREILENVQKVDQKIWAYYTKEKENGTYYYIYQEQLDQEKIEVPALEILEKLNAINEENGMAFLAPINWYDYVRDLYQPENVEALRDHMIFEALRQVAVYCKTDDVGMQVFLKGLEGITLPEVASYAMVSFGGDVLAKEYLRQYLDEETLADADALMEDVKVAAREVVSDADWLTVHGKELAKRKILRMKKNFGENALQYDLSDVVPTGNAIDDYVALKVGNARFLRSQTKVWDEDRGVYGQNMFDANAYYYPWHNSMIITAAMLDRPQCSKDAVFEERLAALGATIAHEISHAYDPNGSSYDEDGYYVPWMKDEEYAAYKERTQKIQEFFDGKEVAFGLKINGGLVKNETFADLMAVECCLRMLEKRDNPDYDLFFQSYAKEYRMNYDAADLRAMLKDTHLPPKERVNYVLAQFDKFYEIYDIDESSPYYVPKEERLPVF